MLEITESLMLDPRIKPIVANLRALGVKLALDDFGTGYSSLLNLSNLPFDLVKIARPFVDAAGGGSSRASGLLAGILDLGRHLGLTPVAEGVERAQQRDVLIELGCELGQGFLLGRPLDGAQTTGLLLANRVP
jgi:EAL domain-containing protein (putative c-di-GMP-specific phosphodiesterase class I)